MSRRQREAIDRSLQSTGYAVSAYLPHNTLLLLPRTASANESELFERELSSAHSLAMERLRPHHKVDPDLRHRTPHTAAPATSRPHLSDSRSCAMC